MVIILKKFPHIFRIFTSIPYSAQLAAIILILISGIGINLFVDIFSRNSDDAQFRMKVLRSPFDPQFHEKLASYYIGINASEAEREYELAQLYFQNSYSQNVLGTSSTPWDRWLQIASKKDRIQEDITLWKNILTVLTDYQYGQLKLAYLFYQLGDKEESNRYFSKAIEQNPMNPLLTSFSSVMK